MCAMGIATSGYSGPDRRVPEDCTPPHIVPSKLCCGPDSRAIHSLRCLGGVVEAAMLPSVLSKVALSAGIAGATARAGEGVGRKLRHQSDSDLRFGQRW